MYKEDGFQLFIVDIGEGNLQLHADIEGPLPKSRLRHIEEVFITLIAALADKGLTQIMTWARPEDVRFCEFFGFEETGFLKVLTYEDGSELLMVEMVYDFPLEEEDD